MHRRNFIKAGAAVTMLNGLGVGNAQDVPTHNWDRYDFGSGPTVSDRLNQGPFGIEQDEGWYTAPPSRHDKAQRRSNSMSKTFRVCLLLMFFTSGAIGEMCKPVLVN